MPEYVITKKQALHCIDLRRGTVTIVFQSLTAALQEQVTEQVLTEILDNAGESGIVLCLDDRSDTYSVRVYVVSTKAWHQVFCTEERIRLLVNVNGSMLPICKTCELPSDEICIANEGLVNEIPECPGCHVHSLECGVITMCDYCGRYFTGELLKNNLQTGDQEICPYCGEVWCE